MKKAAIGILFAGFYTNWPRSLWVGARCEHPLERNSALGRKNCIKNCSRGIKIAINHSCWASFKYKSISIFHLELSRASPSSIWRIKELCCEGIIIHTILIGLHGRICHFFLKHSTLLQRNTQKKRAAYKMKVNFFPLWLARTRWCWWWKKTREITNCDAIWAFTLSLYTWNPSRWLVYQKRAFYWIILQRREKFNRRAVRLMACVWWSAEIHFPITRESRFASPKPENENKIKMCIVKPFNLKTFMLHVR